LTDWKRWFLVVSDSRIQTGRKIIVDIKKIRESSNWLSLKERKR
jgi:phosphopantetheinyl transferase